MKRSAIDEWEHIQMCGETNKTLFNLSKEPDGFSTTKSLFENLKKEFEKIDKDMISLCVGDDVNLTEWANRMKFVIKHFKTIERSLVCHDAGKKYLFDWESVSVSISLLVALRIGAISTIEENQKAQKNSVNKILFSSA
jgi:hypothetical protein